MKTGKKKNNKNKERIEIKCKSTNKKVPYKAFYGCKPYVFNLLTFLKT